MTTITQGSSLEGKGNANSGYRSKTFEKFVNSLAGFRDRVETTGVVRSWTAHMTTSRSST